MIWGCVRMATAVVFLCFGAALLFGGVRLALLGGSAYYVAAGLAIALTAVLLSMRRRSALIVYELYLAATLWWTIYEVGSAPWGWAARTLGPVAAWLWLLLVCSRCHLLSISPGMQRARQGAAVASTAAVVLGGIMVMQSAGGRFTPPNWISPTVSSAVAGADWTGYGKDLSGNRFVPTRQITPGNVSQLRLAWTYRSGDFPHGSFGWEMTPLQVGDRLFICTPSRWVAALDAETGQPLWTFKPPVDDAPAAVGHDCRGVSYHAGRGSGLCGSRVLAVTRTGELWALDAGTGKPCSDFGQSGRVLLLTGVTTTTDRDVINTSPGVVVGDEIILGNYVVDAKSVVAPSGVIRAYDVVTGALRWAWDMGRPDQSGAPAPGETYTQSTPNAWAPFSVDPSLGLVFVPTGNPSPDFFGGYRRTFDERYGSSLVALDVSTGKPRWSFQFVHHDLWDLDTPAQPVLADLKLADGNHAAVIQVTKTGDVFILDRRTGAPLVPVLETRVPTAGGVSEDRVSPTQPRSAISLSPRALREADMWGMTPLDQMLCRIHFRSERYQGMFTPPGIDMALGSPSSNGVFSWGSATWDPVHEVLISNITYVPFDMQLLPRAHPVRMAAGIRPGELGVREQTGTPYRYYTFPMLSGLGIPCNQPPWGELVAIDLKSGGTRWRRPFGTTRDNGPLGIPLGVPLTVGTPNIGGNVTTASGLIFIGATTDRYLRAFDVNNGGELWRASLPAGANASPMSFVGARSGRQFVVIAAGGHLGLSTRKGDYLLAFALPESVH